MSKPKPKRKPKSAAKPKAIESKEAYLARRNAEIERLEGDGIDDPREIALALIASGRMKTRNVNGAVALVKRELSRVRAAHEAERAASVAPEDFGTATEVLDRKRLALIEERDFQRMVRDGEPDATGELATEEIQNGKMITSKPRWSSEVRQRASKLAADLSVQISALEMVILSRRADESAGKAERGEGQALPGLVIHEDGTTPIAELIERNLRAIN